MEFFTALSTVMGTVIGAGVFLKIASIAGVTGSVSSHMFSQFLGGMIPVCTGLTGAELVAAIPETRGTIRYIERIYGDTAASLLGQAQVVIYFPVNIAALSVIFGIQFVNLFGLSQSMIVPVATAAAVSILSISLLSPKAGRAFQSITLVCKLILSFVTVIFGLFRQEGIGSQLFPIQTGENLSFFSALGTGLLTTMFVYGGRVHVGNISGELKKSAKDLSKAISLGIIGIMIVYLLVNAVFLRTASIDGVVGNNNAASDVVKMVFGGSGGRLVTVGILISAYGTTNGYTFAGMHLPYAMVRKDSLPSSKLFAKLHNKTKVPIAVGILELVITIGMMMIDGFDTLTNMLIFVIWISYAMVFVGVIPLRKKEPDLLRPYKVPMYPFIPLIAIIGEAFIVSSTLITWTFLASVGIVSTPAGTSIYLYLKRRQLKHSNFIRTAPLYQTEYFI